jgi:hypothetical protein
VAKTKKHVGDVLGISRTPARATAARPTKSGRRRPTGIDVAPPRPMKRAGVVGGVRGRGR